VRIKHRAGRNTLKMYDKFGSVLRVETTLNDPKGLKVLRSKSKDAEGPKEWLPLRKSVADLTRRTELSQAANSRYLEALGKVDVDAPLSVLTDKLCRPVEVTTKLADGKERKRRYRAVRPFDPAEVRLLETVTRGEYEIAGFRNRDLRVALYGGSLTSADDETAEAAATRRRDAGRVSRQLAMLRAHGLIKKVPRTHRYRLTDNGRIAIAAILAARKVTPQQLAAA
jgi:DNA-binding transcriptional ArsR family regulator